MPHLRCPAGHDINLSRIPNPAGYALIQEPDLESLAEELGELCAGPEGSFKGEAFGLLLPGHPKIRQIYECSKCGRLALFAHPSDLGPQTWYVPEVIDDIVGE